MLTVDQKVVVNTTPSTNKSGRQRRQVQKEQTATYELGHVVGLDAVYYVAGKRHEDGIEVQLLDDDGGNDDIIVSSVYAPDRVQAFVEDDDEIKRKLNLGRKSASNGGDDDDDEIVAIDDDNDDDEAEESKRTKRKKKPAATRKSKKTAAPRSSRRSPRVTPPESPTQEGGDDEKATAPADTASERGSDAEETNEDNTSTNGPAARETGARSKPAKAKSSAHSPDDKTATATTNKRDTKTQTSANQFDYLKAIMDAIADLHADNGSSIHAIKKYIRSQMNEAGDDAWDQSQCAQALKDGVADEKLIQRTKTIYKLVEDEEEDVDESAAGDGDEGEPADNVEELDQDVVDVDVGADEDGDNMAVSSAEDGDNEDDKPVAEADDDDAEDNDMDKADDDDDDDGDEIEVLVVVPGRKRPSRACTQRAKQQGDSLGRIIEDDSKAKVSRSKTAANPKRTPKRKAKKEPKRPAKIARTSKGKDDDEMMKDVTTTVETSDDDIAEDDKEINEVSADEKKKPVTKGEKSDIDGEEDKDAPLSSLKTKKKPKSAKPSKRAGAKSTGEDKASDDKKEAAPKRKRAPRKPKEKLKGKDGDDSDSSYTDRPFKVDYAPTSRATCRRCDAAIERNTVRVSHRPMFRGKPGYVVYRHLVCATFDEDIIDAKQVGGWRRLEDEDLEKLQTRIDESMLEVEQEKKELHADELVQASFKGQLRPSPPGLAASLLPFQQEGTSWMYCQEIQDTDVKGGILADEMGMGKTLQSITVVLDNRPKLQHSKPGAKHPPSSPDIDERKREEKLWETARSQWDHEMKMINVPKKILPKATKTKVGSGARAGTLVICPVIALYQWKTEIEKFTEGNALTVGIYHGPNRLKEFPREMLCKYDVVLTTYQVLEADFRKMVSPNKVKCPNCGGSYKIDKLRVHLKYFCGEAAQRTEAQARQRRTRDRAEQRRGGNGDDADSDDDDDDDGDSGKGKMTNKKKSFKKPTMTKLTKKSEAKKKKKMPAPKKPAAKKPIRVKSRGGYESESELSGDDEVQFISSTKRPSRSAARAATKRMSSSFKEQDDSMAEESDNEGSIVTKVETSEDDSAGDDGDNDDSDASVVVKKKARSNSKAMRTKSSTKKKAGDDDDDNDDDSDDGDSSDSDSDSDDEDNLALERAKKKQKLALMRAKNAQAKAAEQYKKDAAKGEKKGAKKKAAAKPTKKKAAKGKKPPLPDESSDSDSSDDDDNDNGRDVDPLEGIDLNALMEEAMAGSRASPLHTFCWWRVILDEAHMIKSRSSQTAAAAFSLTAINRWCLSGTPLQNRVGELYSLIRFLRIDPMAHYFCRAKGCDCKSIHYRMMHQKCLDCGHGSVQHFSHFNKHVLNPIQRDGYQGDGRRAMLKLKEDVLDRCLIRRTKQTRAADMNLPPRLVTIRTIRLHPVEEDFYNALYTQTKNSFDDFVSEGTLLNNYSHIFDLLSKMRQAVDHPYLIVYSKKNMEKMAQAGARTPIANGCVDCEICNEPPTDRVVSSCCGAAFCRACVTDFMSPVLENANRNGTNCPSCNAPFSIDLNQASSDVVDEGTLTVDNEEVDDPTTVGRPTDGMPSLKEISHVSSGSILRRLNLAEFSTSTKLEALVQELIQMRRERPGSKALVFSQFVNMLDLARWRLHSDPCLRDLGIGVRIIHGGMNVQSRDEALKAFKEDPSVRVLLMSLKAGGVALNLTVANEAYLLDPWWNPAAEAQAIDRTHRLGQFRPIRAVRFIAEGTVEERVLQLQEKKRLVFDGTVGRDAASLKMLTVNDMKSLFM